MVYDDTLELIKLFKNGHLILLDGKKRTQETSGIYISYDSRTDFMQVHNTLDGVSVPGAGYTNAIIYPKDDKAKPPVKPAPAQSDTKTTTTPGSKGNGASDTKSTTTPVTTSSAPAVNKATTIPASSKEAVNE